MDTSTLALLCIAAFTAGFVDAIVGGGGLIQLPVALVLLPSFPVASVVGSLKIPSFSGTVFAAIQYIRKVKVNLRLLLLMMLLSTLTAFVGSLLLTKVHNDFMKPILMLVLIMVAIYTYSKKNFGQHISKELSNVKRILYAVIISIVIGFYDGFIGPGTGSFLILSLITIIGIDFLQASANAKMVNLATNAGSITLFLIKGTIIWSIAIPMAICNALGGIIGARLAIIKGNKFIRIFFLIVIVGTLIRFAYDVFIRR